MAKPKIEVKNMLISMVPVELRREFKMICAAKDWDMRDPLIDYINQFVKTKGKIYEKSVTKNQED
jgi:hypothetical protein